MTLVAVAIERSRTRGADHSALSFQAAILGPDSRFPSLTKGRGHIFSVKEL